MFTPQELDHLYEKLEKYLIKRSNIDLDELNTFRERNKESIYEEVPSEYDMELKEKYQHLLDHPIISEKEKLNLMIEALFYNFFEGIDIETWEKDLKISFRTNKHDPEQLNSVDYFKAMERLRNKRKFYIKQKQEP